MEAEDTEYLKLPLEDRCTHKLWKARVNGFEECTTYFATLDEKAPEFNKFAPLMKKFVTDANALAQEKALDAVLSFASNAHVAGRTAADVTAGIVLKCLAAAKRTTQEKALAVLLMYCEIEKFEPVQEELVKGISQKNPKVVAGCIKAISTALREFGSKVIAIKPLVKVMGTLLEDRDKNIREETKKMVVEMYRWVGPPLKPQMSSLKPIQIQELEAEFEKLGSAKPVPNRLLRSQQEVVAVAKVQEEGDDEADGDEEASKEPDPLDLFDPVNILDQLPKDFYEKAEAKKWQERKEALDTLLPLSQNAKLESGDYADLVRVLKKIIGKDTNVMIIAIAGQCLAGLAKGLKKKFGPYSIACSETIFEKFKEKKINVVTALREAIDAIFHCTTLEALQETFVGALNNKNPNVKAETAGFLARAFCYCTPTILNKKMLKVITTELLKALSESDPNVRENAAEALGTVLKVVGEKILGPFIVDLDALKMQKVKEFSEKAEIKVKITVPKAKPKSAPPKEPAKPAVVKPSGVKKAALSSKPKKPGEPKGVKGGGGGGHEDSLEMELTLEEALERVDEILPPDVISGLADTNWKVRLSATEKFYSVIKGQDLKKITCQALVKILSNKPGLKDNNFQIMKLKLDALKYLAECGNFSRRSAEIVLQDLVERLGDAKNGTQVMEVLSSISEAAKFQWVALEVITSALSQKSPKIQEMGLKWFSDAIKEFGFTLPAKTIVPNIKSALGNSNPTVRTAAISLCGTIYMYMGPSFRSHFETEKAAIVQQLDAEFEKVGAEQPPVPTRGQSADNDPYGEAESHFNEPMENLNKEKPRVKNPLAGSGGKSKLDRSPASSASGVRGAAVKKGIRAPSAGRGVSSSKKEEEVDSSPLLQVNDMKQEREREERRLKTLKWDFSIPRPEFITQLKDQLTNANANKQLISNMFHQDFKFHIRAIDSLIEDLPSDVDACVSNLDLVLRWLTIRFFDTNPSVIMKGMDYLQQVFTLLSGRGYHLTELEASSFLPYLITKFGEPKNSIRGPAREICKLICNIYPSSKVSPYILNGLRSKNARQRSECLEAIGSLIEIYGMTVVCQAPSTSGTRDNMSAIKEIAKQIADRDNSVRNAALNALVQVYFREGEKVYKMIGNVSGKDLCLLEERIKRSAKSRPIIRKPTIESDSPPPRAPNPVNSGGTGVARPNRVIPTPAVHPAPSLREANMNTAAAPAPELGGLRRAFQRPLSGDASNLNNRIHIDIDFLSKLLDDKEEERPPLHLEEIPDMASILSDDTTCQIKSRFKGHNFTSTMGANIINANVNNEDNSQAINMVISQVGTHEVETVITALSQLDEVIQSEDKRPLLFPHIDQILTIATLQYKIVLTTKMAHSQNIEECIRIYRSLTNCLMSIFNNKELGSKATIGPLHGTIHAVVSILLDSRLPLLEDGPQIIRALNVLVVRMIEKAQFTHIFSAVLKLLHESVNGDVNPKFTELVMRCNWKCIRLLQEKGGELDIPLILTDILEFMKEYPSHTWSVKTCSKPLRTIKTVIHRLVEIHGSSVLSYLSKVPNSQGSELQKYVIKAINTTKSSGVPEDVGTTDSNRLVAECQNKESDMQSTKSAKKLSKSANSTLSEIFKKIGSKENTKEGLVQLYEFKQKNPDADIDSYLRKSSTFFQNYIEKGLKKVEMERQQLEGSGSKMSTSASSDGSQNSAPLSSLQVQDTKNGVNFNELVDQFKVLAAQAGFDNSYIDSAVKDIGVKD